MRPGSKTLPGGDPARSRRSLIWSSAATTGSATSRAARPPLPLRRRPRRPPARVAPPPARPIDAAADRRPAGPPTPSRPRAARRSRQRAGAAARPPAPGEPAGHRGRPDRDPGLARPVRRRQPVRHVPPGLRRRHGASTARGSTTSAARRLKPLVEALQSGDLYRLKGHCGGPSTDFIEQVHVVVYERSLGRLRANAFSYSGNPQGCDHAVRHLQTTLDALQAKLSRTIPATVPAQAGNGAIWLTPGGN